MPLYEYECSACQKRTEKIQKFSDPEITVCPSCDGPLERVLSAPAFSLKGGGWYADGYASAKPATGGTSSDGGASKAAGDTAAASAPATPPAATSAATAAPATKS